MKEENALLRGQLLDIQASLSQLTTSNHATVRDAEVLTFQAVRVAMTAVLSMLCCLCARAVFHDNICLAHCQ